MADLDLADTGLTQQQILDSIYVGGTKTDGVHQEKLLKASRNEADCMYIISGDSTRELPYNDVQEYYANQLAKISVTTLQDCYPGMSAQEWLENVVPQAGLQHAIDNTTGTGETTVLEYSFGINASPDANTEADEQIYIEGGIIAYLAAKPDATVVLVSPLGGEVERAGLTAIYESVSSNLTLEMVNGTVPMNAVYRNKFFMNDNTHPNKFGSQRWINYVLSELLPDKCRLAVNMEDKETTGVNNFFELTVSNTFYNTGNGNQQVDATSRAFDKIDVVAGTEYDIYHQGTAHWVTFYDSGGVFLESITATDSGDGLTYRVTAPANAVQAGVMIAYQDGITWEAENNMYWVIETGTEVFRYYKQLDLNDGVPISLPYLSNTNLDVAGVLPVASQVPTGNADGTWNWA